MMGNLRVFLLCFVCLVTMALIKAKQPLIVCKGNKEHVQFEFPFHVEEQDRRVVLVDPSGTEILSWRDSTTTFSFAYRERISNFSVQRGKMQFTLADVSPDLDGKFMCHYDSPSGPAIPFCGEILHFINLRTPRIISGEAAIEGERVKLFCLVEDLPSETDFQLTIAYTWFKDSRVVRGQKQKMLTLENAMLSDEGAYSCRVMETSRGCSPSLQSHPLSLQLLRRPKVHIEPNPPREPMEISKSQDLTLTCVVEHAYPTVPTNGFSWTFSPSDSSPPRQLPETKKALVLGPLTKANSGKYTCWARNDQNFNNLTLQGNASAHVLVTYLENIQLNPDLEVEEGTKFTLICRVESSPTAQLHWVVNGVLQRTVNANVDHYVVMKATKEDSGNYTCLATNGNFSELQSTAYVNCTSSIFWVEVPNGLTGLSQDVIVYIAAGASAFVLIVITIIVVALLCRRRCCTHPYDQERRRGEKSPQEQGFSLLLFD